MDKNKKELLQNLSVQLQEIEILSAMFPNENELVWPDPSILLDAEEFCESQGRSAFNELQCLSFPVLSSITIDVKRATARITLN